MPQSPRPLGRGRSPASARVQAVLQIDEARPGAPTRRKRDTERQIDEIVGGLQRHRGVEIAQFTPAHLVQEPSGIHPLPDVRLLSITSHSAFRITGSQGEVERSLYRARGAAARPDLQGLTGMGAGYRVPVGHQFSIGVICDGLASSVSETTRNR